MHNHQELTATYLLVLPLFSTSQPTLCVMPQLRHLTVDSSESHVRFLFPLEKLLHDRHPGLFDGGTVMTTG